MDCCGDVICVGGDVDDMILVCFGDDVVGVVFVVVGEDEVCFGWCWVIVVG